ncbi:hypothetical protein Gogos_015344 [Gossypium gossypioides]|uniref:RNase H type-1 domain-containing protein n=1 Tax=Gossypium gossypioides TaxID=34282 RepID=A0A7J9C1B5_GOSGO|nr:hypothetical protein [Gossypium gossypioides]
MQLITSNFTTDEAIKILCIPLVRTQQDDMLAWSEETSGCPKCLDGQEILEHVFRDCLVAIQVWHEKLPVQRIGGEQWSPSKQPFVKINYDTAFRAYSLKSCSSIIVKYTNGIVLSTKVVINKYVPSIFTAEALACLQAVNVGLDIGPEKMIVEGDLLTVVKKLQSEQQDGLVLKKKRDCEKTRVHIEVMRCQNRWMKWWIETSSESPIFDNSAIAGNGGRNSIK